MMQRHKIKRNGINANAGADMGALAQISNDVVGIAIKPTIGVGDALQYSSVPENYFRHTGKRLVDMDRPWFFDHNPFVTRDASVKPGRVVEMWNFSPKQYDWPNPRQRDRPAVYLSNAEIHASVFGAPAALIRPRLYQFEDYPFEKRRAILLHTDGRSHGMMPDYIIEHVIRKYDGTGELICIGNTPPAGYDLPWIETRTLWDLAAVISSARMLIGMDSGPAWIAACYPDVIVKKLRMKPSPERFYDWVPLEIGNIHSHWDDRCHQVFNPTDENIGFTAAYTQI